LARDLKRWKLPRTESLSHLESGEVNTPYNPSDLTCRAAKLYIAFKENMKGKVTQRDSGRLRIFNRISSKADDCTDVLPLIKNHGEEDIGIDPAQSIAKETWQDLLLGIGGKWEHAMEEAEKKRKVVPSPSSIAH